MRYKFNKLTKGRKSGVGKGRKIEGKKKAKVRKDWDDNEIDRDRE